MKKFTCVFLALVYVLLVMKPFMPYVEYTLLKDHIIELLCINKEKPELSCNGKCYLNKQLKKTNDADPETDQTPKPQPELKLFSILINCITEIEPANSRKILFSLNDLFITEYYCDIPLPPPKELC